MRSPIQPLMMAVGVWALFVCSPPNLRAQSPLVIDWQKCLGGTLPEAGYSIEQTDDGGYILTGAAGSNDGDVGGVHGGSDVWVVKLDLAGTLEWQYSFGGSEADEGRDIHQTMDGGYIVAGSTYSMDGDVTGHHGATDYWVLKLDPTGQLEWQKCLGGSDGDVAYSVRQTADGGYIVTGFTFSNDGDVSELQGGRDAWLVKLASDGALQWQRCIGGLGEDGAREVVLTTDGGYVLAGWGNSNNIPIDDQYGAPNLWVVKLDALGETEWQRFMGGSAYDQAWAIQQTADEGYIVAGETASNDGDAVGNHGGYDAWVIKLDMNGVPQWQKCLGGTAHEFANALHKTDTGGFIIAGTTLSNDGDVNGNHGSIDAWLVQLDPNGDMLWQECIGGTMDDYAWSLSSTSADGIIMAGTTSSNNGDVTGQHGMFDVLVVKFRKFDMGIGQLETDSTDAIRVFPSPANDVLHIQCGLDLGDRVALKIIDVDGRVVHDEQLPTGNIDVYTIPIASLSQGVYVVQLSSGKGSLVNRFIKN